MSASNLHVLVLAAGQGKRMRSMAPKVLQKLAGQPLLEHVLALAAELEPLSTTVVYGHGGDQVRAWGADRALHWIEQNPPRGTGDAVRRALPPGSPALQSTDGVVLVLYGDVPLLQAATLAPLLASARAGRLALLTQLLADPSGYGRILRDTNGAVTAIVEHKDANAAQRACREVNTGILAAPAASLAAWVGLLDCHNAQGEYYLTDVVELAVEAHCDIDTFQPEHPWEADGVNDPIQLARLERIWQRHLAHQLMLEGARLADPERIDQRGRLRIGSDVEIDVGCVFEGNVTLAGGVVIESNCVLKDCEIGPGTRIRAFSHLEGARVAAECVIGPYARLRPGSTLGHGAQIGNFVEIKNSTLGSGSKANHLSYVGDASVGCGVNIGAGVITCNYDGASKHRTVIGDGAFIGSDSQLVAPVTVGAGATIGAGTTLVSDAPADQLTLSRPPQLSVASWQRPQKPSRESGGT